MAENSNSHYETRRLARGVEPPAGVSTLRRKLALYGFITAAIVLLAAGVLIWLKLTRVRTVRAFVRASVVSVAPVADAKLVSLLIREGDQVSKGQLLGRLNDKELKAALEAAMATKMTKASEFQQSKAECARVEALIKAQTAGALARREIAQAEVEAAEGKLRARRSRLADEISEAEARHKESAAWLAGLKKGPSNEQILASQARMEATEALCKLYQLELEQSRQLVTEGIDSQHILEVRKTRLLTQQKITEEARLNLVELRAGATAEEIEAAEQAVEQRRARLSMARQGVNDLDALEIQLSMREAGLREKEAQIEEAEAEQAGVILARERVRAASAELEKADAGVNRSQAALETSHIFSPVDGTVIRVLYREGEVCRKGFPCIIVADDSKPRWIEGLVREKDAMMVSPGQRARVRAPAGFGRYTDAVVEWVGLHTESLEQRQAVPDRKASVNAMPERVWVRLRPTEPLKNDTVTGTRAQGIILIRENRGS